MPQKEAGFVCLHQVLGLLRFPVYRNVTIAKGDALQAEGTGFAQLGQDNLTVPEFLGIASEAVDNGSGSDGDLFVQVIPPLPQYRFYVPVESGQVDASNRGELVDLNTEDGIDITDDAVTTGWAFYVDEIAISDNYVYGYWRIAG